MKWLLRIVVTLVAVALLVIVVGMSLPHNHFATRSAHLSAPPDQVWSIITEVGASPTRESRSAEAGIIESCPMEVAAESQLPRMERSITRSSGSFRGS